MQERSSDDPVPRRLREALIAAHGDRLERVCFSARARGDFRHDSDYDIAVFIHDPATPWEELPEISTHILVDIGAVISAKPFPAGAYNNPLPLMREIRRDGLDL